MAEQRDARLLTEADFGRIGDACGRWLTPLNRADLEIACGDFVLALSFVDGASSDHKKELAALERWAAEGLRRFKELSTDARFASRINVYGQVGMAPKNLDSDHVEWLASVKERARSGRAQIERYGKLYGVVWRRPHDYLIRRVAEELELPLETAVDKDGPTGPLFWVMRAIYQALGDRDGHLKHAMGAAWLSDEGLRSRIRAAAKPEADPEPEGTKRKKARKTKRKKARKK